MDATMGVHTDAIIIAIRVVCQLAQAIAILLADPIVRALQVKKYVLFILLMETRTDEPYGI